MTFPIWWESHKIPWFQTTFNLGSNTWSIGFCHRFCQFHTFRLTSLLFTFVSPTQLPCIQSGCADARGAHEWRRHGSLQSPGMTSLENPIYKLYNNLCISHTYTYIYIIYIYISIYHIYIYLSYIYIIIYPWIFASHHLSNSIAFPIFLLSLNIPSSILFHIFMSSISFPNDFLMISSRIHQVKPLPM
jgi:hypothetical protein